MGCGPFVNYSFEQYERQTEAYYKNSNEIHSNYYKINENIWNVGISILAGLEVIVYKNISFFTEYEATIYRGWHNIDNYRAINYHSDENYSINSLILDVLQPFISNKKCWLCYDVAKAYYNKQHKNIEVNKFFLENQKSIKQVHLHDVNENGRGHRVIGSGLIDFNEILLNIKNSPVIDYCIEVRPRSKALESLKNLNQILISYA